MKGAMPIEVKRALDFPVAEAGARAGAELKPALIHKANAS